jgi:hypothetical protein
VVTGCRDKLELESSESADFPGEARGGIRWKGDKDSRGLSHLLEKLVVRGGKA